MKDGLSKGIVFGEYDCFGRINHQQVIAHLVDAITILG